MSNLSVNLDLKNAADVTTNVEPDMPSSPSVFTAEKITAEKSTSTANTFNKSKRWSFIQSDLEKALNTWVTLEKAEINLSPEQEQFVKIQTIIGQLKEKLEQF